MPNAHISEGALAIQHEADLLNRFDGQGALRFDQSAVMCQIVYADRIAAIKRAPEGPEYFKTNPGPSIPWRFHHAPQPPIL